VLPQSRTSLHRIPAPFSRTIPLDFEFRAHDAGTAFRSQRLPLPDSEHPRPSRHLTMQLQRLPSPARKTRIECLALTWQSGPTNHTAAPKSPARNRKRLAQHAPRFPPAARERRAERTAAHAHGAVALTSRAHVPARDRRSADGRICAFCDMLDRTDRLTSGPARRFLGFRRGGSCRPPTPPALHDAKSARETPPRPRAKPNRNPGPV